MELEIGLPSIYIRDGNYKFNFEKEEIIKVCFYFDNFIKKTNIYNKFLKKVNLNIYEFSGEIISIRKVYGPTLIAIDTGDLIFYSVKDPKENFDIGDIVSGKGKLNLDPYYWFESLDEPTNIEDIYSVFKINKIKAIKYLPEIIKVEGGNIGNRDKFKEISEIFSTLNYSNDFLTDFIFILEKQDEFLKTNIPYTSID